MSQEENIGLIEEIANSPDNLASTTARKGGFEHLFQGSYNGLTIEVKVFESTAGDFWISDAWVK